MRRLSSGGGAVHAVVVKRGEGAHEINSLAQDVEAERVASSFKQQPMPVSPKSHILAESRADFLQTWRRILPIYSVTRIGDHARTESGFSIGKEMDGMSRPFAPLIAMFTAVLRGASLPAHHTSSSPS